MMKNRFLILACLLLFAGLGFAQSSKSNKAGEWVKVHDDDEVVTVYYNSNITTDKRGRHIVWVKAVYHSRKWQNYFAEQIDPEGDWGPVNASDPVGIVGEYLGK